MTERSLSFLQDIPVQVSVRLGTTSMTVSELASLGPDDIVELDRLAEAPLDLLVGGRVVAHGDIVLAGNRMALRIRQVVGDEARRKSA